PASDPAPFGFGLPPPIGFEASTWGRTVDAPPVKARELASRLAQAGYAQTAVVEVGGPGEEAVVVKAIVPGLAAGGRTRRRPAELHPFGMAGVGRIFTAYASGRLTGDDEVAVAHAPAELDWLPLSEPLVNVRATLTRAVRAKVLSPGAGRAVLDTARAIFFRD